MMGNIVAPSRVVVKGRLPLFHVAKVVKSPKVHELIHLSSYRSPVANRLAEIFQHQRKSDPLVKFYEF
jgi:hypothetical protein